MWVQSSAREEILRRTGRSLGLRTSASVGEVLGHLARVPQRARARRIARELFEGLALSGHPVQEDGHSYFLFDGPRRRRVFLAGNHNGWAQGAEPLTPLGESGLFVLRRPQLTAGTEYKFVVDGRWKPDPANPFEAWDGHGGYNSRISTWGSGAVVAHPGLRSKSLKKKKPFYVYLPPGYDPAGPVRYPVLYVKDGRENLHRGQVPRVLDEAIQAGRLPPVIAVLLPHPGRYRHLEYTPFYRKSWAGAFHHFVVAELVPWIDSHYATVAAPHGRTVWGQSYGAVSSVGLVGSHPGVFGHVLAQSGTYVMGRWDLRQPLLQTSRRDTRFYVDGTTGFFERSQSRALARGLEAAGYPHLHRSVPSRHEYEDWSLRLVDALRWLWLGVEP